ncbi:MAG: glycosyltransferase [Mucilaginibacter sp.]|uniref:glycosyltransferase n=1 Tax=Mucilaginibacter sp. TaxID=1882438 RepID=UPI0034E5F35B
MKLLLIITDFGSFNNFLSELALFLEEKTDIEVCVICSKSKVINIEDKDVYYKKLTFHFIDIPRRITILGEWKAAKQIKKVIETEQPDLVHSHFTTATCPVILLKDKSVSYWATFHGLGMNASSGFKKIIFTLVEMLCFFKLKKIFTVNKQDFNLVRNHFGSKAYKYNCLGFGCDTNKFNPESVSFKVKTELRIKHHINSNHIVIAFTGRYVSFKGFHLVIKSFRHLSHTYPGKYKLILMGGRDSIHPTGLNEIENKFFKESGDIINIGFTSNVEHYLAITDIFLFPSKKEGLPTCILEALSMGVPVITFKSRGNEDVIRNGYNGLLIQPSDSDDTTLDVKNICNSLTLLVRDIGEREKFKLNSLNDRHKYSRTDFVNEQLKYYREFEQLTSQIN